VGLIKYTAKLIKNAYAQVAVTIQMAIQTVFNVLQTHLSQQLVDHVSAIKIANYGIQFPTLARADVQQINSG